MPVSRQIARRRTARPRSCHPIALRPDQIDDQGRTSVAVVGACQDAEDGRGLAQPEELRLIRRWVSSAEPYCDVFELEPLGRLRTLPDADAQSLVTAEIRTGRQLFRTPDGHKVNGLLGITKEHPPHHDRRLVRHAEKLGHIGRCRSYADLYGRPISSASARSKDLTILTEILTEDVTAWNDGGGKVWAALNGQPSRPSLRPA
jgi:hypothetical protein